MAKRKADEDNVDPHCKKTGNDFLQLIPIYITITSNPEWYRNDIMNLCRDNNETFT
jgi:hypothetical protein